MSALVDDDLFHRRVTVGLQQVALNVVHNDQQFVGGGLIAVIELHGLDCYRLRFESAPVFGTGKSSSSNTRSIVRQCNEWNYTAPLGSLTAVAGLQCFQVVENHLGSRHCGVPAYLLHS